MNNTNSARDMFLYLMALISLAASAISLGTLLFQIINNFIPDPVNIYSGGFYEGAVRYSTAVLIVMFPVFICVARFIKNDLIANPEKSSLGIRKVLLYFTVFVASLVIIVDLIALILSFLNGELTARFALKALVIFGISAAVFSYYLRELRWEPGAAQKAPMFLWLSVLVVLASIITGFVIAGSPKDQRESRFDNEKISNLMSIESSILDWYSAKKSLPTSLSDLRNSPYPVTIEDPQTDMMYEYRIISNNPPRYSLCAQFNNDYNKYDQYSYVQTKWEYKAGRYCFELIIDEDFLKRY